MYIYVTLLILVLSVGDFVCFRSFDGSYQCCQGAECHICLCTVTWPGHHLLQQQGGHLSQEKIRTGKQNHCTSLLVKQLLWAIEI